MTATAPFDGKAFSRGLSTAPGVYRMIGADDKVLYVGKASALKNRVSSYFNATPKSARIMAMLSQTVRMEVTVTRTEAEALILENELIKSLKPRYNVLLRDDKSYPYVLLTNEAWPRIAVHRGPRSIPGRYFGPYASVGAVRDTLNLMHKLFKLRSCEDSVFRNRSRPCLQHQIGRCSAPCVGLVSAREYAESVRRATLLLEGRSDELTDELGRAMEGAAQRLDFEEAARLRDLVSSIRTLQARQYVDGRAADLDVLAVSMQGAAACVVLLAFRDGRNLGTRSFFPRTNGSENAEEVLAAFVSQYYGEQLPPGEIVIDRDIPDRELIQQALSASGERKVEIRHRVRGDRAGYLDMARRNAQITLASERTSHAAQLARAEDLRELLGMAALPQRIECFDISHTMGEATVASCVVFDAEGPVRGQYRRYNIAGIEPGDDYAAMHQAISRRFRRAVASDTVDVDDPAAATRRKRVDKAAAVLPDILLIDGGPAPWRRGTAAARWAVRPPGCRLARIATGAAGPRRGAPVRHHRPSRSAPEGAQHQPVGGHPGHRPAPPRQPVAPLRRTRRAQGRRRRGDLPRGRRERCPGRTHLCDPARTRKRWQCPRGRCDTE